MTKSHLRSRSISLRQQGYSYSLIKDKTGVSKSTLCDWLKNIPYKPNKETLKRMNMGRIKSVTTIKDLKQKRDIETKHLAQIELGEISDRDLMMVGIGLYIGEGGKYNKGFVQFSNSDPKVINLIMKWFTSCLKVEIQNIYLIVHAYPDNNVKDILRFWSKLTKVPLDQFGKTYIDTRTNKLLRNKGKLKNGTLHIRLRNLEKYRRVALFQKILRWIEIVENKNFAGIV